MISPVSRRKSVKMYEKEQLLALTKHPPPRDQKHLLARQPGIHHPTDSSLPTKIKTRKTNILAAFR